MFDRTIQKLLAITILTIVISGYLFYEGLKPYFSQAKKEQNQVVQSENTNVLPQENVLGEEKSATASAVTANMATVTKVIDGDTIEANIGGQIVKIRYIGIDTPETVDPRRPVGCFGKEASIENKRLVEGQKLMLEKDVSETDKFGRLLRYVYLKLDDGTNLFVNDYMVRQGFSQASTFPPDVKYAEQFKAAQQQAMDNKRGLWGKCKSD